MPVQESALQATYDEVFHWMLELFKERLKSNLREERASYGFDVYLPNIVSAYLRQYGAQQGEDSHLSPQASRLAPTFLNCAWEMCLKGILRPSWSSFNDQNMVGPGYGYSFTKQGRQWLLEGGSDALLMSTGKMGELFSQFKSRFGEGFHERAQEALRCYSARAYFGCCAMCGAASESILLRLSIEKLGDEKKALQIYHGKQGRKELRDKVLELPQKPESIKNEVGAGFTVLAYWRDDAAHGSAQNMDSTQANIALQMLCLFALAADKHWTTLTT